MVAVEGGALSRSGGLVVIPNEVVDKRERA